LFTALLTPCFIFSQEGAGASPAAAAGNVPAAAAEGNAAEGAAAPDAGGAARPGTAASRAQEDALGFFSDTPAGNNGTGGATGAANAPAAKRPSAILAILRMILVLAIVAIVIYFLVGLLRRLGKPPAEQNPHLKILSSAHLGSGRYIHAVAVGKNAYLIGSGEGGVNHIADINDQEAVDLMILDASKKTAEAAPPLFDFQSLLKKFQGGITAKEQDRLENMRRRRERFKRFQDEN
jgi:flagellar biogenesis protein FliO